MVGYGSMTTELLSHPRPRPHPHHTPPREPPHPFYRQRRPTLPKSQLKRRHNIKTFLKLENIPSESEIFYTNNSSTDELTTSFASLNTNESLNTDVNSSPFPSSIIIVLNAGYTGFGAVTGDELHGIFARHEGFERVLMMKGKPYSIALYKTPENAWKAYKSLNNQSVSRKLNLTVPNNATNEDEDEDDETNKTTKPLFLEIAKYLPPSFETILNPPEKVDIDSHDYIVITRPEIVAQTLPGLTLISDFITPEIEAELITAMENRGIADTSNDDALWTDLFHRSVQHFGYEPSRVPGNTYTRSHIHLLPPEKQLPEYIQSLIITQLSTICETSTPQRPLPNQLTINKYLPGQGIAPHIDSEKAFGKIIYVVSLLNPVVIDFLQKTNNNNNSETGGVGNQGKKKREVGVFLPPRSLLLMEGEARYDWEHTIRPRRVDMVDGMIYERKLRYSLTFRIVE